MNYKLIKDITPPYTGQKERVGFYLDKQGKEVVIKKSDSSKEKLNTAYLKNEAKVLRLLAKAKLKTKIFPQIIEATENESEFYLVEEKASGKRLDLADKKTRVAVGKKVYTLLNELGDELAEKNNLILTKKDTLYFLFRFPIHIVKTISKDFANTGFYLKLLIIFYTNYLLGIFTKVKYGFVHGDLWSDNILYDNNKNSITILDWEGASITDRLYDLAQIAMAFNTDFTTKELQDFLNENLETNGQRRRFIVLALFSSLLMLGNIKRSDKSFSDIQFFIKKLISKIMPGMMYKKSPYEIINNLTLNLIHFFYKITGLSMVDTNKKYILCYHSIGNDGWRFSTRLNTFAEHLDYLKKHYQLLSLNEILNSKKGGLQISFDDGYENVLQIALPKLRDIDGKPTVFAIGEPKKANRRELNNNLRIMNYDQLLELKKNGWEIGFHTATHAYMAGLNKSELEEEIVQGKKNFEKKTGIKLKYFAYPKGKYSNEIIDKVQQAGFEAAFTVDGKELNIDQKNKLTLHRIPIDGEMTKEQLGALLSPLGLITSNIFLKVLAFKERYLF